MLRTAIVYIALLVILAAFLAFIGWIVITVRVG
jgi:hypothetical protein